MPRRSFPTHSGSRWEPGPGSADPVPVSARRWLAAPRAGFGQGASGTPGSPVVRGHRGGPHGAPLEPGATR